MHGYLIPHWPAPANIRAYTVLRTSQHNLVLPSEPVWLNQIHGGEMVLAEKNRYAKADGSYTRENNIICVVNTADCLPVLMTNKSGSGIAAVHAGWKGLAKNILKNAVEKLNCEPKDLLVWLGPAISAKNYEVGQDMKDYFLGYPEGFKIIENKSGKYYADLYKLARLKLAELNIENKNIFGGDFCTYDNPDLFHSARRDKEKSGRLTSMIWMENASGLA